MPSANTPGASSTPPTVLLVDDSRVMRKAIGMILTQEFTLIEAEDGEDGWEKLTSNPEIQVIISDIEMPRLDGFGLLERLRNFEDIRISQMPVIIITGAEDEETRQSALDQGATDFVTKPVDKTQLLARVRTNARFTETRRTLEDTSYSLKSESTQDPITGLNSRRFFLQRGEQDIAYAKRHGQGLAVLRLDIDRFRRFYTDYGDDAVDDILVCIAKLLKSHARVEDTVARIGGSAFAVLAPSTSPVEAMILAERLRSAIAQNPAQWQNVSIPMTASIGLVTLSHHLEADITGLLKLAEDHLRQARRAGGDKLSSDDMVAASTASPVKSEASTRTAEIEPLAETLGDISIPEIPEEPGTAALEEIDLTESKALINKSGSLEPVGDQALSMDEALAALAAGDAHRVEPYLSSLLRQFLPFLEHCNDKLDLGIGVATQVVRHKIENPEEE
ncbi:MAG: diguanylate cyclase [Acidiferrobacterales bacterium]|jgi:two-component system cell cycle response regulator|nr:diguanylate cyclase [Acidiferrobacterales bacterium]